MVIVQDDTTTPATEFVSATELLAPEPTTHRIAAQLDDAIRERGLEGVRNVRSILYAARQTDDQVQDPTEIEAAEPQAA